MLKRVFVFVLVMAGMVMAQVVFTRVDHPVYDLLSRLDARHIISFNSEVKPLSRMEIAGLLLQIEENRDKLYPLEVEELKFLMQEFALELSTSPLTPLLKGEGNDCEV